MRILLIRHALTAGNLQKRYIGRTDEPLCKEGIQSLNNRFVEHCDMLVSSPLLRCLQTAEILFPSQQIHICNAFQECDFGDFEGKNYNELNGNPDYQAWIDSGGLLPFPNGESPLAFRERCCKGFLQLYEQFYDAKSIAMIIHGGTIMAILSHFAIPHRSYYDWMTDNAHGWICEFGGKQITVLEKI